ncbi:hypothetical protein I2486_21175 [Cellulophaga sp. E16_2]|uniref:hypothetical protein n=1 Tax=Cellulophaga sp. E16_2 TaxID=2789297 RepID=UPI001A91418C|nr:hypothetical protein [Cellulophaga sp. E16_2]MBO0593924.1 hypothetical protein [Cellulophaga sp. E16_2]
MTSNKKLKIRVSTTYVEPLEKAIENHNEFNGTDFFIANVNYDEVIFCDITATKYTLEDIFSIGYKSAVLHSKMEVEGRK